MNSPHSIIPSHDAHVQTAFAAAFAFGREQYLARTKFKDYDLSNALRALNAMRGEKPTVPVVGGGNTLAGKIKWLLENEGDFNGPKLAARLGAKPASVSTVAAMLFNLCEIQRTGKCRQYVYSARKAVGV